MLEKTVLTILDFSICMTILHIRQDFEDALGSKCAMVLNMAWLYMQWLNSSEYV